MPGGSPVGTPGPGRKVREVGGGKQAADKMFDELIKGGTQNNPVGYPGQGYDLVGGGWVGLRPTSKTGEPTIDVNIPGIPLRKIKFK
jgi:hypothetical protein